MTDRLSKLSVSFFQKKREKKNTKMMTNKYFDTSSLLILGDSLFEETHDYNIYITSITLNELEHIKTSVNKD